MGHTHEQTVKCANPACPTLIASATAALDDFTSDLTNGQLPEIVKALIAVQAAHDDLAHARSTSVANRNHAADILTARALDLAVVLAGVLDLEELDRETSTGVMDEGQSWGENAYPPEWRDEPPACPACGEETFDDFVRTV